MNVTDPYRTPQSKLVDGSSADAVTPGDYDLVRAMEDGWRLVWGSIGVWLPAMLVGMILFLLSYVTIIGIFLAIPPLIWGGVFMCLRIVDGRGDFDDLFEGFRRYGQSLGPLLMLGLCMFLVMVPVYALIFIPAYLEMIELQMVGTLLSYVVIFYVYVRAMFAPFFIVDRQLSGVEALKASFAATQGKYWLTFALYLVAVNILPMVGMMALCIGIFPAAMMGYLMVASAYRQMIPVTPASDNAAGQPSQ